MAQPVRPPYPPENFSLNAFLVEIADEITEDDVHKMKSLLTDSNGGKADVAEEDDVLCKELERLAKVNSDLKNRIEILSSQLVREQRKVLSEEEPLFGDAPIRFGWEDEIKRIDKAFAIHIGEFQAFSSEFVWPSDGPRFYFLEILDDCVQQLQKNLEDIKHIREKRPTDFTSEYNISNPDRTGEGYFRSRRRKLFPYQDYLRDDSSQDVKLDQMKGDVHENCNRLALYLRNAEKDLRVLRSVAAQYDSTPWIERNLSLINQKLQTVEGYVKEYIEALKKITHTLIQKDVSTDSPIRFGSQDEIKGIDTKFAYLVAELQTLSSTFASSPGGVNYEFVKIFNDIQRQLQKNLEHIKRIREKRQTFFKPEYDKFKPRGTGKDDLFWHLRLPQRYLLGKKHGWRYPDQARKLREICRELEVNIHRLNAYLTDTQEDVIVLGLIPAQYDFASWVDRNLSVIDQELQTVEDIVKKYIEALKKITPRLPEDDDSTDFEQRKRTVLGRGLSEREKGREEYSELTSIVKGGEEYSYIGPRVAEGGLLTPMFKYETASPQKGKILRMVMTEASLAEKGKKLSTEPPFEPETPYSSTSLDATEKTKASSDETRHKHLGF